MFAFASLVALASAALPQVFAHGGVLSYQIEGQIYQGWAVSRVSRFFSFCAPPIRLLARSWRGGTLNSDARLTRPI